MALRDIESQIDEQTASLECARAVLCEAMHHFEHKEYLHLLQYHAEHILLLLYATDDILRGMQTGLSAASDALHSDCNAASKLLK